MGVKTHSEHTSNKMAIENSVISLRDYGPAIERNTGDLVTEEKYS